MEEILTKIKQHFYTFTRLILVLILSQRHEKPILFMPYFLATIILLPLGLFFIRDRYKSFYFIEKVIFTIVFLVLEIVNRDFFV